MNSVKEISWQLVSVLDFVDRLRTAVESINHKSPIPFEFPYVFNEIYQGRAGLYVNQDALIVVRKDHNQRYNEFVLFVWLAYSTRGDALTAYIPDTLRLAKSLDCAKVQFQSTRTGYSRREEVKVLGYLYEMQV